MTRDIRSPSPVGVFQVGRGWYRPRPYGVVVLTPLRPSTVAKFVRADLRASRLALAIALVLDFPVPSNHVRRLSPATGRAVLCMKQTLAAASFTGSGYVFSKSSRADRA